MTRRQLLQTLMNFTAILLAGLSGDAAELALRPLVRCQSNVVRLGDIARVDATDDESFAAELARVELFPAPVGKQGRVVRDGEVLELLRLRGVNVDQVRFRGPTSSRVYPPLDARPTGVQTAVEDESTPPPMERLVVASRPLDRGDIIRAVDVELREVEVSVRNAQYARSLDEVVGKELVQPVAANRFLDPRYTRLPIIVRRGEQVFVTALAAGVQVRTTAKATQDGSLGDLIIVESENRLKYSASVAGPQHVVVYASGRAVQAAPVDSLRPASLSHNSSSIVREP